MIAATQVQSSSESEGEEELDDKAMGVGPGPDEASEWRSDPEPSRAASAVGASGVAPTPAGYSQLDNLLQNEKEDGGMNDGEKHMARLAHALKNEGPVAYYAAAPSPSQPASFVKPDPPVARKNRGQVSTKSASSKTTMVDDEQVVENVPIDGGEEVPVEEEVPSAEEMAAAEEVAVGGAAT